LRRRGFKWETGESSRERRNQVGTRRGGNIRGEGSGNHAGGRGESSGREGGIKREGRGNQAGGKGESSGREGGIKQGEGETRTGQEESIRTGESTGDRENHAGAEGIMRGQGKLLGAGEIKWEEGKSRWRRGN
jgi:hypothetical protein